MAAQDPRVRIALANFGPLIATTIDVLDETQMVPKFPFRYRSLLRTNREFEGKVPRPISTLQRFRSLPTAHYTFNLQLQSHTGRTRVWSRATERRWVCRDALIQHGHELDPLRAPHVACVRTADFQSNCLLCLGSKRVK